MLSNTVLHGETSSVHIEVQVPKQGQQHYAHQNHPDDSQHPEAFANRKLFYRLSSAPRWPMVVHEDGGPKIENQIGSSHAMLVAYCSRSFNGMPSSAFLRLVKI